MKSGYTLITGASSGIGREMANCFAADGTPLILVARSKDKLEQAATEIKAQYGVESLVYISDLSKSGEPEKLYEWTKSQGVSVLCLVNNAGFGDKTDVKDADLARLQEMMNLNMNALVTLSKLYAKDMSEAKSGRIANIASVAGLVPGPGMAVYYATKSFVLNFSQALAKELEPFGVTVTAICPGATKSGFASAANASKSKLFSGNLPSSEAVAEFAYKAIKSGKLVAIWGVQNRIMSHIVGLLPKKIVLAAVRSIQ